VLSVLAILAARLLLVLLFLPFSALDKILNFNQAVGQAEQAVRLRPVAILLICAGLGIEIIMSLAILTGVADRFAALILSGYCVTTALLWKQFWKSGDFRLRGPSKGRDVFWDFLKNLAVAGGFLMLTFGTTAAGVQVFLQAPLASSHPYSQSNVASGP
jgi:putative oxidoreductase